MLLTKKRIISVVFFIYRGFIGTVFNLYNLFTANDLHSYWGIIANLLVAISQVLNIKNDNKEKILIVYKYVLKN